MNATATPATIATRARIRNLRTGLGRAGDPVGGDAGVPARIFLPGAVGRVQDVEPAGGQLAVQRFGVVGQAVRIVPADDDLDWGVQLRQQRRQPGEIGGVAADVRNRFNVTRAGIGREVVVQYEARHVVTP